MLSCCARYTSSSATYFLSDNHNNNNERTPLTFHLNPFQEPISSKHQHNQHSPEYGATSPMKSIQWNLLHSVDPTSDTTQRIALYYGTSSSDIDHDHLTVAPHLPIPIHSTTRNNLLTLCARTWKPGEQSLCCEGIGVDVKTKELVLRSYCFPRGTSLRVLMDDVMIKPLPTLHQYMVANATKMSPGVVHVLGVEGSLSGVLDTTRLMVAVVTKQGRV
eukprot:PhF_6_TR7334/c0_g1_i2/m.11020